MPIANVRSLGARDELVPVLVPGEPAQDELVDDELAAEAMEVGSGRRSSLRSDCQYSDASRRGHGLTVLILIIGKRGRGLSARRRRRRRRWWWW